MITLKDVDRIFQVGDEEVHALKDVALHIAAGEYVSVMGPSGSGKSTLLNLLGLLDRPTRGTYHLDGVLTTELSDNQQAQVRRHKVGFIFQSFHLIPRLTAAGNVELPLILAGVDPHERQTKVTNALDALGLSERSDHRPDQLSGGQRQRVAMARAIVMEPKVLLADEPTGNLDRASGQDVIDIMEELNQRGITLIVVTHDPLLGKRATRRIRMVDGYIEQDTGAS